MFHNRVRVVGAFRAVLFDLDGTLIDSTAAVRQAWARWAQEEGVDWERVAAMHGRPARDIVAATVPAGHRDDALARYTARAATETDTVVVLPGAMEALAITRGRSAVVTASSREVALARMEAAGLPVPAVLVTAEDVTSGKPEPEPFLRGAAALGRGPGDCLAVEDTPVGVTAARRAGCTALGLCGTGPASELGAHYAVGDLSGAHFVRSEGRVRCYVAAERSPAAVAPAAAVPS